MAEAVRIEISVEAVDNTSKTVQELIKNLQGIGNAAAKTQGSVDKASSSVSKFDTQANKTTKTLQGWVKQKWQLAIEAKDRVAPVLSTLKTGLSSLTKKTWSVTMKALDLITSPVRGIINLLRNPLFQAGAVLGVSISLKDTIETYKTFEASMSQVKAISGATGSEYEKLTAKAKEMGATTKFTAAETAEAFNYMAMAGWKTSDMLSGIEGILNLAAASGEDLATTSDIVTDALTAFKMEAGDATHFADVLAAASSNANTNVAMMGETFKYAGAMAGTLGYSIEDVGLAIGLMANSGIKASTAGTELNSIFTRLSTNSNHARDAIENLGIKFFDETGTARAFADVLGEMRKATANMTDEEKTAFANTVAGTRAQAGLLAMLNATEEDYNKLAEAIYNADGASSRMAETMLDNLQGSFTLLQSAVDGAKISLGERLAPYLRGFADWITGNMPAVQRGIESFMDWFDRKVETFKGRWKEAVTSEDFQKADFIGKAKILWDKIIGEPLSDWWNTTGKQKVADIAAKVGHNFGTGIKTGIMALFGIDISDAASEGVSIGKSFAEGFADGFDFKLVAQSFGQGIKNMLADVAKLLPGGESAGLDTMISGVILAKLATPLVRGGKFLFGSNQALGGKSLAGTILGSASAGTGLLGLGSNTAISLGAGNLAGGASLGVGALSAIGLGSIAGGVIGAGSLISGGIDLYKARKAQSAEEANLLKDTGGMKIGGAVAGAALGAAIGSVIPGLGTAAGALIGAGIGGIAGIVSAKKRQREYEEAAAAAEAEAAAHELIMSKAAATGSILTNIRFKTEELNDAFHDTNVTAEEFQQLFNEVVTKRISDAFGTITLSLQEIKDIADSIVFDGAAVAIEKMEDAIKTSEKALSSFKDDLSSIEKTNWRISLGLGLSAEEMESYQTTIDQFVKDAKTYINDKHYEATLALRVIYGQGANTSGLDLTYAGLEEQLQTLTDQLNETIEKALADGTITNKPVVLPDGTIQLNELAEITHLQNQITEIVNKVNQAEQDARLDSLKIKYSGANLSAESFAQLQQELAADIQSATESYDQALQISLTNLHLQLSEGAISPEEFEEQFAELTEQYRLNVSNLNLRSESFQLQTIADAFAEELEGVLPQLEGTMSEKLRTVMETALAVSPNPAEWTMEEMSTWFGLDDMEQDTKAAILTKLQSVAETVPSNIKEQLASQIDAMTLTEATDLLKNTLSTDISQAIADTDLSAAYDGIKTLRDLIAEQARITLGEKLDIEMPIQVTITGTTVNEAGGSHSSGSFDSSGGLHSNNPRSSFYGANPEVSGNAKHRAVGGFTSGAELTWIGEDGPEAVIPLSLKRRERGLELYEQVGEILGIAKNANGGLYSPSIALFAADNNTPTERTWDVSTHSQGFTSADKAPTTSTPVNVTVQAQPTFVIEGGGDMTEDQIVSAVGRHMGEFADDIGEELAQRLIRVFENMPVRGVT